MSTKRNGLRDLVSIAALVVGLLAARSSLADHYTVPSESMEPTIQVGDHIAVNKLAYGLRVPFTHVKLATFDGPERGDVVVLDSPEEEKVLLKRVAAVPGDLVSVRNGEIFIDGRPLPHAHRIRLDAGGGPELAPVRVPQDRYLVLGDNRGDSRDGRYFGFVTREAILGRAVAIVGRAGRPELSSLLAR
jgi:signal peptidase I